MIAIVWPLAQTAGLRDTRSVNRYRHPPMPDRARGMP